MKKETSNVVEAPGAIATQKNNLSITDTPVSAGALISFRESGYSNYSAIADIIDNSLDEGVNSKNIFIKTSNSKIIISDDGCGMNEEELTNALTLGKSNKDYSVALGKYGLGLNTATSSLGKRVIVITKKKNGEHFTGIYDIDDINERFNNTGKISIEIGLSSEENIKEFLNLTKNSKSGTVVIIEKIDNISDSNEVRFAATLSKEVGRVFRKFITDGKNIFINDKKIESVDPLCLSHPETKILGDQVHNIEFSNDGQKHDFKIRMIAVLLPVFTLEDKKEFKWVSPNTHSQGFYILRNNREIAKAITLGAFEKDQNTLHLRIEMHLTGDMDKTLGLTFNKTTLSRVAQGFIDKVREETSQYRSLAKKEKKARTVKGLESEEFKQDISDIKKEIDSKFNRMEPVVEEENKNKKEVVFTASLEEKKKDKSLDKKNPKVKNVNKKSELIEFEFAKNGEFAPIYEPTYLGNKKVQVTWNTDHIFFTKYLNGEVKKSLEIINKLALSLSRVELKKANQSDEVASLLEDFRIEFSNELRQLMD
jgi:hypothetical protein